MTDDRELLSSQVETTGERGSNLTIYRSLTDSRKRQLLHWLLTAKSQATRQRRIEAILQEVAE